MNCIAKAYYYEYGMLQHVASGIWESADKAMDEVCYLASRIEQPIEHIEVEHLGTKNAFGVGVLGGLGWVCRNNYRGGFFGDFGGDGYSRTQAVALMNAWDAQRDDVLSTQLFMIQPARRNRTKAMVCAGRFSEPLNYEQQMIDSLL